MSRIISGKIRLNVQRVELGSVVEAAVETVRRQQKQRKFASSRFSILSWYRIR